MNVEKNDPSATFTSLEEISVEIIESHPIINYFFEQIQRFGEHHYPNNNTILPTRSVKMLMVQYINFENLLVDNIFYQATCCSDSTTLQTLIDNAGVDIVNRLKGFFYLADICMKKPETPINWSILLGGQGTPLRLRLPPDIA